MGKFHFFFFFDNYLSATIVAGYYRFIGLWENGRFVKKL